MTVNSTSIEPVIGKILRDTRLKDMSYVDDMQVWIPEALDMMRIQRGLSYKYCVLRIGPDKRALLPKGIAGVGAIVYDGKRITPSKSARALQAPKLASSFYNVSAIVRETVDLSPTASKTFWNSVVVRLDATETDRKNHYFIELDILHFTKANVELELHYWIQPHDANGFPLIPDSSTLREALYWYVRMKMIHSGHKDIVYGYDTREVTYNWELYAGRAINELDYPTPDETEASIPLSTRWIFSSQYFHQFFEE